MDQRIASLANIFAVNTGLLHNCLDGVNDGLANRRITPDCNTLAFLAAHLTDARHYICKVLAKELPNPLSEVLGKGKTLDEIGALPPLTEIVTAWDAVSAHLAAVLAVVDDATLEGKTHRFPGADGTVLGGLAFLAQHDSYHIGQMALLRRQLGLGAMGY